MEHRVGQVPLADVPGWLDATVASAELLGEVRRSTSRISELVRAVREYTYMDQATQQDVDVHGGIENTLIILNHKTPTRIAIVREYALTLPRIPAHGSERNEAWTNVIDNAIDAIVSRGGAGTIMSVVMFGAFCSSVDERVDGLGLTEE